METLTIEDLNPPEVVAAVRGQKPKGRKHINAQRVQIDGIWFDSQTEGRRYEYLYALQVAGEIQDLRVHPQFTVIPGFVSANGKRTPAVKFKPDFAYYQGNKWIVEDVKGLRKTKTLKKPKPAQASEFILRRKLFQQQNPTAHFQLVCESRRDDWLEFYY